jgi:hypothetical protein
MSIAMRFKKRLIYISILLLALLILFWSGTWLKAQNNSLSDNPSALFYQAGSSYEKGDYQKAIALYNTLVKNGFESGNLYFNLANSYFKLGRKGEAILFYEKAKQLMPNDADLKSNLSYALRGVDEGHSSWQLDFYQSITSIGSLENLMALSSIMFFIFGGYLSLFFIFPMPFQNRNNGKLKPWCLGTLICIASLLILSLSLTVITGMEQRNPKAVVIESGGEVRFEPKAQTTIYYHLAEGTRVCILEKKPGWIRIQRRDGKIGWIEDKFLTEI